MEFYNEQRFSEAEEVTKEEIMSRVEQVVIDFLETLNMEDKHHEFEMIKRSKSNLMEAEDAFRLGHEKKKRKIRNLSSRKSYQRVWSVLVVVYDLLRQDKHMTQREMFYLLYRHFSSQSALNDLIQDVSSILRVPREMMGVRASPKGWIGGSLEWNVGEGWIDVSEMGIPGLQIPGYFPRSLQIRSSDARYIIVCEKDGVFKRILEDKFHKKVCPVILVTACGYPDLATRKVLHFMHSTLRLPVLGLFDFNPHGAQILLTYILGSQRFGLEAYRYGVPMKWLGVHYGDVQELELLPKMDLSAGDKKTLRRLKGLRYVRERPRMLQEVEKMESFKVEIQTINNLSYSYLSGVYLKKKIIAQKYF